MLSHLASTARRMAGIVTRMAGKVTSFGPGGKSMGGIGW